MTAVHTNESVTPAPEATPRAPHAGALASVLADLLRSLGRTESGSALASAVCEVVVRGLGLEGALLRVRNGEGLRALGGAGPGVGPDNVPPGAMDLHPWPVAAGPVALAPEFLVRLLPSVAGRWPAVQAMPLGVASEPTGVLYLGTAPGRVFGPEEQDLLRTLGEALGPELQRRIAHEQLVDSVRGREEALAVVAHDLRNPLHAITVGVSMLLPRITEPTLRRPVERIQRSAQRMERLLQDLLDIHAIEGGRFAVSTGEMSPTALILTALESQQNLAGQTSVIIATDVAPALPLVHADEERILQVLENLVGNALKFTPPGGVVTVGATHAAEPGSALFFVRDTGPGISREHLPRVFDRFFQGQSSDRRGTGLGLAICKAIVEAHGGRIWVDSGTGKGAPRAATLYARDS